MPDDTLSAKCCCHSQAAVPKPCCQSTSEVDRTPGSHRGHSWITGEIPSQMGDIPQVGTRLGWADYLGVWKVRWGLGRMNYRVSPGLYAVGSPGPDSPVLVSANYKMSFDRLRSNLRGGDAWILVLDTKGVNVWCAAGKGTFGTEELVRRIQQFHLADFLSHRKVIVPQLGAPGVAAHEVQERTGMKVVYGPVRAEDLPAFLAAGQKATPSMRQVQFLFLDRLVLIPVELVTTAKWLLLFAGLLLLLAGFGKAGYSWSSILEVGLPSAGLFLATGVFSLVLGPALLPWLPGRPFALKGFWMGLMVPLICLWSGWYATALFTNWWATVGWLLLLPATGSFLVLKFSGATPITSLSGVRWETKVVLPIQLSFCLLGLLFWVVGRFW